MFKPIDLAFLRKASCHSVLATTLLYTGISSAASVKVAFIGDQGVGEHAQSVLSLIASEGTDLLLIQGDLGYGENAAAQWEDNLTNALGADFPVLTVVGNHENYEWPEYQRLTQERIDRASSLSCTGNTGVKASCQFANIDIVQVSPGIHEVEGVKAEDNYAQYIASSLADSTADWRICSWHKNQEKLQTGKKGDATGWDVYDSCLDAGAMVAVAHEHAYSRTYLLSDFRNQTVIHRRSEMTMESGSSFAFVSGLGGREVRPQVKSGDWWAAIYTATQGATHGALFCEFEEKTADCYFKAIDGAVPDQFTLISRLDASTGAESLNAAVPEQANSSSVTDNVASESSAPAANVEVAAVNPLAVEEPATTNDTAAEGVVAEPGPAATDGSDSTTASSPAKLPTAVVDLSTSETGVEGPLAAANTSAETQVTAGLGESDVQESDLETFSYPNPAPPQVDSAESGGAAGTGKPSALLLILMAIWWQRRAGFGRSTEAKQFKAKH
ncbi:MAG: hypothetical protein HKN42_02290 [Granulosicoccus sp.]|nr:hypothetical protein [Granulosicoccus sp.]